MAIIAYQVNIELTTLLGSPTERYWNQYLETVIMEPSQKSQCS